MPEPTSASGAATAAQGNASASDQMMQKIMQQILMPQENMGDMVQNRPQVMIPGAIHPKQIPMDEPTGNVNATTQAGQRRNDMNSLISSIGNIVKTGVNKKREKEDRDMTADLALIQAASSNPDDPHNKQLIEAIAQDPKRVKRLQKALGYNPFSGEPPPPETQTMMKFQAGSQQRQQQKAQQITQAIATKLGPQAAQQGGGGQPNAMPGQGGGALDNFMAKMPNTPQLSTAVQLQASLIKAGILPKADTSLQSMTSLFKDIMTSDAKYAEVIGKLQNTDKVLAGRLAEIRERGKYLMDVEKMKQEGAGKRATTRASATVESAKVRANATVEAQKLRNKSIEQRQGLTKQHQLLQKEVTAIDQDIKNLDVQIAAADKSRKLQLVREQEMKKELKSAKQNLMDILGNHSSHIDDQLKQSPTSLLNEGGGQNDEDLSKEMDDEDKIF